MKEYKYMTVENLPDKPKHLFYLVAFTKDENCGYVIANYSAKTDKLTIKDCSNFLPSTTVLRDFVKASKDKYEERKVK